MKCTGSRKLVALPPCGEIPEQEAADGRSHLRVRLLVRDDGILVIDQGVRIRAWSKC
jgi:hypothetical protein